MDSQALAQQISPGSTGERLLPPLVACSLESERVRQFLAAATDLIVQHTDYQSAAIVQGTKGVWRKLADAGPVDDALPEDVLADVLDQNHAATAGLWAAAPLQSASDSSELLLVSTSPEDTSDRIGELESIASAVSIVIQALREQIRLRRSADRLSAMLEMTAQWNQTQETNTLLETMAETSIELLEAERATIFLWDKTGARLIGRPAVGIEEGELVLADNLGVVGQVVQTGQPQRVDEDVADEQAQIDRQVDESLNFQTRSIICVPILDSAGATIGAFELINKKSGNFTGDDQTALTELAAHAGVAIENTRHVQHLETSRRQVAELAAEHVQLIGSSSQINELRDTVATLANTELAALILGENGTGKEVVAQMIHYMGPRRDNIMVAVNCAAISETLLESELFGHEKGAFTDASDSRQGKFELADGGTLFLDEIGDMSLSGQAKLLRVVEQKVVVRVGGSVPIATDVRVIAATNQNLAELVQQKKFREDLYFRLNVVTLQLPPLRERGEDVALLAEHFLKQFCAQAKRAAPRFTAAAKKQLLAHDWPGNVRELRNMMERVAYLHTGDRIEPEDLAFAAGTKSKDADQIETGLSLAEATKRFQSIYIQRSVDQMRGNMTDAAAKLGLHRSNLYRKMRQLGMSADDEE